MPIRFDDEANRYTYANRVVDETWLTMMRGLFNASGCRVADVGCGGGNYTKAWLNLGAASVTGIDSSRVMLGAAQEQCQAFAAASFLHGDAQALPVPDATFDIVFERALIHHLPELAVNFGEVFRALSPGGVLVIQDRTPEDIALPGAVDHIRGYFFDCFPQLLSIEQSRRWSIETVNTVLADVGFQSIVVKMNWEVRRTYTDFDQLAKDLYKRTGRSILHELSDAQLGELISFIKAKLEGQIELDGQLIEQDRWTIWLAFKP